MQGSGPGLASTASICAEVIAAVLSTSRSQALQCRVRESPLISSQLSLQGFAIRSSRLGR
jgi:hypothetical protein